MPPPPTSGDALPRKKIPGSSGLPFFGPIKDRFDYFYIQGRDKFFQTKIDKHNSTVFRTNMPPGPFISPDSTVVCVLDAVSFPILFDTDKVEKRNILDGTYLPSLTYTGGYRILAYLDPSEPKHALLKRFCFSFLAARHRQFIPLFRSSMAELFVELEDELGKTKTGVKFNSMCDDMSYDFIFRLFCGKSPAESVAGAKGASFFTKWLFFMLAPIATLGLSKFLIPLEDLLLHTFRLPSVVIRSDYQKLYSIFYESTTPLLDEAESMGISREEACNNLVFLAGFSSFGGMKVLFPILIKWVASAGRDLHRQLADEIRTVVSAEGGVTFGALEKMTLTKSVVYECMRIDPPVPFQYAKAKVDVVVHSHDASFEIKKGETIFGYQPFATKDRRVFDRADEFVGHRFVGPEGEKLLKYVYWSNGRETEDPTVENKQCPGKDLVVLLSRVFLVEFFLRYDTFDVETGTLLLGTSVTFKSVTKVGST